MCKTDFKQPAETCAMAVLIRWRNDWFVGTRVQSTQKPNLRYRLQGANDQRLVSLGFSRASVRKDEHLYCVFERDPGFIYYPTLKYYNCIVSLQSIHPRALPREVFVFWGPGASVPPDIDQWEVTKGEYGSVILSRYIKIDDLEKEEGTIPDWSLPAD